MKSTALITLAVALMALSESYSHPAEYRQLPAPINDISHSRHERSANPDPQWHLDTWQRGGSVDAGGRYDFVNNDRGSLSGKLGARFPANQFTPSIGVAGSYNLPTGTVRATWDRVPSGPQRGSTTAVEYQHEVYNNPKGSLHLTAVAEKSTNQPVQARLGAEWRFQSR